MKSFLDGEIKWKTWTEIRNQRLLNTLFENAGNLASAQKRGVGETSIKKFLGEKG